MNQFPPSQGDPASPPATWDDSGEAAPSPSASVQATMNQMTDRLQTVIDAAERAADAIRHDAEEQARRHLAEAQRKADRMTAERVRMISELTDDLIRHAGAVRDHSEQMVSSLEDAITSVTGKLDEAALAESAGAEDGYEAPHLAPVPAPSTSPNPAVPEAVADHTPPSPDPPVPAPEIPSTEPAAVSQEAILHATRLAVAGNDREEISRALREEHGVSDPDPIVDRVFGRV